MNACLMPAVVCQLAGLNADEQHQRLLLKKLSGEVNRGAGAVTGCCQQSYHGMEPPCVVHSSGMSKQRHTILYC